MSTTTPPPITIFIKTPGWTPSGKPNGSYYAAYIYNELPDGARAQITVFYLDRVKTPPSGVSGFPQVHIRGSGFVPYGEPSIRWLLAWATKIGVKINMVALHPSAARFSSPTTIIESKRDHLSAIPVASSRAGFSSSSGAGSGTGSGTKFNLPKTMEVGGDEVGSVLYPDMLNTEKWHVQKPDSRETATMPPVKTEDEWLYDLTDDGKHDTDAAHLAVWDTGSSILDESDGVGGIILGTPMDTADEKTEEDIVLESDGKKTLRPPKSDSTGKITDGEAEAYIAMRARHDKELEARIKPQPGAKMT